MTATARQQDAPERDVATRIAAIDAATLAASLDAGGYAVVKLLTTDECSALAARYDDGTKFRSRVVMARHGYGQGEYQYFAYPLPPVITALREALYTQLAPIANRWNEAMQIDVRYPPDHAAFIARCHHAGQQRPTPLLLRYRAGDYNRLHQDLYGEHVFPLQATVLLSQPETDFTGGEFVLVEQRARMQSRAEVVRLSQGDMVIFAVNQRPVTSSRGFTRVAMRHGVSKLTAGARMTLGVILHDAK
jgi:hypothetical protein